jgi:hypothetical protein
MSSFREILAFQLPNFQRISRLHRPQLPTTKMAIMPLPEQLGRNSAAMILD